MVGAVALEVWPAADGVDNEDVLLTAAAAAVAYRTGNAAGGREGKPFFSTLDIGCDEADIGGGGFGAITRLNI